MLEIMPAAAKRAVCKFKGEPTFGSYRIGKTNSSTLSAVYLPPIRSTPVATIRGIPGLRYSSPWRISFLTQDNPDFIILEPFLRKCRESRVSSSPETTY